MAKKIPYKKFENNDFINNLNYSISKDNQKNTKKQKKAVIQDDRTILNRLFFNGSHDTQTKIGILIQRSIIDISKAKYPFHIIARYVPLLIGKKRNNKDFTLKTKGIDRLLKNLVIQGHDINKSMNEMKPLELMVRLYGCSRTARGQFQDIVKAFIINGAMPYLPTNPCIREMWNPKKMREYISLWTVGEGYRFQHFRRGTPRIEIKSERSLFALNFNGSKRKFLNDRAKKIEMYMAQYFRNSATLTPEAPQNLLPKNIVLYRSIHGILAEQMIKNGFLDDNHYMAFSRSKTTSSGYLTKSSSLNEEGTDISFVLELKFGDIPPGTPLLWFKDILFGVLSKSKFERTWGKLGYVRGYHHFDNKEVILPPGKLVPLDRRELHKLHKYGQYISNQKERWNMNNLKVKDPIRIRYVPNINSKSLNGKKIIRRGVS